MDLRDKKVIDLVLSEADFLIEEYGFMFVSIFIDPWAVNFCYEKRDLGICFAFEMRECALDTYFFNAGIYHQKNPPFEDLVIAGDYYKRISIIRDFSNYPKIDRKDPILYEVLNAVTSLKLFGIPILKSSKFVS